MEQTDAGRFGGYPGHDGPLGPDWAHPSQQQGGPRAAGGAQRALIAAKRAPRWAKVAAAVGMVVVLALGISAATNWFSDPNGTSAGGTPRPDASSAPPTPLIEVQQFTDLRGITVNVPQSWMKTPGGSASNPYYDYVDPSDRNRRIRINVENATVTPRRFLEAAEDRLKRTSGSCAPPYTRVGLEDSRLDGRDAALLEYTCGAAEAQRHALWTALVLGGKSYHFFLTVPESKFAESKIIFQEMVRTFKVTPPSSGS